MKKKPGAFLSFKKLLGAPSNPLERNGESIDYYNEKDYQFLYSSIQAHDGH